LLGHNGAGKTTMINMLTGMLPITSGDALIYGKPCSSDMDGIRAMMGICPQHDVLWNQLTGLEHVTLFAGLRGVPVAKIEQEAQKRLEEVELWDVRHVQSSAYSGGMRRYGGICDPGNVGTWERGNVGTWERGNVGTCEPVNL